MISVISQSTMFRENISFSFPFLELFLSVTSLLSLCPNFLKIFFPRAFVDRRSDDEGSRVLLFFIICIQTFFKFQQRIEKKNRRRPKKKSYYKEISFFIFFYILKMKKRCEFEMDDGIKSKYINFFLF